MKKPARSAANQRSGRRFVMYTDDDLLPISALQHLLYCERQCALIHVERQWAENRLTAEGRALHDRVDERTTEIRGDCRICRALEVRSARLGLIGRCDLVEFQGGVPFPVEYKRGRPKSADYDRIQLCAQAMCLEEALGKAVPAGALFYGQTRRRLDVGMDEGLRDLTEKKARRLHDLIDNGITPPPCNDERCEACSLANICVPRIVAHDVVRYMKTILE